MFLTRTKHVYWNLDFVDSFLIVVFAMRSHLPSLGFIL